MGYAAIVVSSSAVGRFALPVSCAGVYTLAPPSLNPAPKRFGLNLFRAPLHNGGMTEKHTHKNAHAFAGLDDWFEIFRAGKQTDSQGRTTHFTTDDLDSIVASHESAPLVFGHPKSNDPAYGWTSALKREGNVLLAKAGDVVAEFSDAVKNKLFPKRSVSIEPHGDGYKLNHIGFLGAKRPAVPGLADIQFATHDNAMEFAMDSAEKFDVSRGLKAAARMLRGFREWLIEEKDLDTANQVIPGWDIDSLDDAADDVRRDNKNNNNFNADDLEEKDLNMDTNTDKQFTQADVDAAAKAARETALAESQSALRFAQRKNEAATLVDALVTEGRLLPAQVDGLAEFMAALPEAEDSAFEFAAADKSTGKKTPAQFMADFMGSLGKQISFGAAGGEDPDGDRAADHYHGYGVSTERAELDRKAKQYMKKNNVDYITAVAAVETEGE